MLDRLLINHLRKDPTVQYGAVVSSTTVQLIYPRDNARYLVVLAMGSAQTHQLFFGDTAGTVQGFQSMAGEENFYICEDLHGDWVRQALWANVQSGTSSIWWMTMSYSPYAQYLMEKVVRNELSDL